MVTTAEGFTKRARSSTWPWVSSPAIPFFSQRTLVTPKYSRKPCAKSSLVKPGFLSCTLLRTLFQHGANRRFGRGVLGEEIGAFGLRQMAENLGKGPWNRPKFPGPIG